jgi:hypothetical protein
VNEKDAVYAEKAAVQQAENEAKLKAKPKAKVKEVISALPLGRGTRQLADYLKG